jgi:hypothetical protein
MASSPQSPAVTPAPARESIGAALRFVRSHWQTIAMAAGAVALAQAAAMLLTGPSLIWMVVLIAGFAVTYALYLNAALGAGDPRQGIAGHAGRLVLGMGMIGVFVFIVMLMVIFVAMYVLIAPYSAEIAAAGENEAAVRAIMERALAANPNVFLFSLTAGMVLLFVLTTRFYFAAPATVDRRRVTVFDSWRMTRGSFMRILTARIVLLGPALILVGALQSLAAMLLGAPSDPASLIAYGQTNRVGFALFYASAIFFQLSIFSALEAGLSANLYRALKPADAPPVVRGSTDSR